MTWISQLLLPLLLALFGLLCLFTRRDVGGAFLLGAKEGLSSGVGLLPTLILLMTAVSMFSASGAPQALAALLSPFMTALGIPSELTALLLVRPLSGSGSTALLSDLLETYGPDSFVSQCAAVLTASSDTLIYVVSVYLAAAGVRHSRHTLPAAIGVMLLGNVLACLLVRILL